MTYSDAIEMGLDPARFIENERELDGVRVTCTSSEQAYSVKRLTFREKDVYAYTGLLRTKVRKGYWSQFVCVVHLRGCKAFIVILSEDMANNIMQRFVWKMYDPMQFRVLMGVKRHLLFEDIPAFDDSDI